jgi:hypothetical protein
MAKSEANLQPFVDKTNIFQRLTPLPFCLQKVNVNPFNF